MEAIHKIVMEITLLIMENHGIVFLNFCGNPVIEYQFLVATEPPSFLLEPTDTIVDQGNNVRIDCLGLGEPEPEMNWMIGWDILQDEGRLSILPNNSLRYLTIAWVKVFSINPEFTILRLTFHRKSASKC